MAKIQYVKHHYGILPGTIVNEHREKVVADLTRDEIPDPENPNKMVKIQPVAVLVDDATPTTAEEEQQGKSLRAGQLQTKPARAPIVRNKAVAPKAE
jgi:hypothetical protein